MEQNLQTPMKSLTEQLGLKVDASLDTQIMTARAFPRNLKQCMENILDLATMDQEIAASCYYTLPRAGNKITGPSIRLAEICASFWGNMQAGSRIVSNDGKAVVVEGWCWDLQSNLKISSEVTKSIRDKTGKVYSSDMQATTCAAASAIALRNAIFKIVPQVFIEKAYKKAMDIAVNGGGGAQAFEKNRRGAFEGLKRFGIPVETVLSYYKRTSIDLITEDDLKEIIGIGTSIKDGYLKAEDAFVIPETRSDRIASLIDEDVSDYSMGEAA